MQFQSLPFLITNNEAMQRAIVRAKSNAPKTSAKIINADERIFEIKSANDTKTYRVEFFVVNKKRLAKCTHLETGESCKGLTCKTVCYHVAIAAGINIGIRQNELNLIAEIEATPRAEITLINAFCDTCPTNQHGESEGLKRAGWFLGKNEQFCPTCNY